MLCELPHRTTAPIYARIVLLFDASNAIQFQNVQIIIQAAENIKQTVDRFNTENNIFDSHYS